MATADTLLANHVTTRMETVSLDVKAPDGKAPEQLQDLARVREQAAARVETPQGPEQADDEFVRKFEAAVKATVSEELKATARSNLQLLLVSQENKACQLLQSMLISPSEKAVHENPEAAEEIVKLLTDCEFPGARETQEAVGIVSYKTLDQLRTRLFQTVRDSLKWANLLTVKAVRFQNPFMDGYQSPCFTPRHFKAAGESVIVRATQPTGVPPSKPVIPITPPPL